MSDGRYLPQLKSALGWPVRRMLDPRFDAAVAAVDYRLGSFDGARPPVHHRLDEIEVKLDGMARRFDEIQGELARVIERIEGVALEQRAMDEGVSAILERVQRMAVPAGPGLASPSDD